MRDELLLANGEKGFVVNSYSCEIRTSKTPSFVECLLFEKKWNQLFNTIISYCSESDPFDSKIFSSKKEAMNYLKKKRVDLQGLAKQNKSNGGYRYLSPTIYSIVELDCDCENIIGWSLGGIVYRHSGDFEHYAITERDSCFFGFRKDDIEKNDVCHLIEVFVKDDENGIPQTKRRLIQSIVCTDDSEECFKKVSERVEKFVISGKIDLV